MVKCDRDERLFLMAGRIPEQDFPTPNMAGDVVDRSQFGGDTPLHEWRRESHGMEMFGQMGPGLGDGDGVAGDKTHIHAVFSVIEFTIHKPGNQRVPREPNLTGQGGLDSHGLLDSSRVRADGGVVGQHYAQADDNHHGHTGR
jgi:hypothetical protein